MWCFCVDVVCTDTGVQNPVSMHLPVGAKRVLMSPSAKAFVNIHDYVETLDLTKPTVFIIGELRCMYLPQSSQCVCGCVFRVCVWLLSAIRA